MMRGRHRVAPRRWASVMAVAVFACGNPRDSGKTAELTEPDPYEPIDEGPLLPPLDVAVVGSAAKVRPDAFASGASSARLFAARNEFESFQVVVNAPGVPVRGLTVSLRGALRGPHGASIPLSNVTVYREGYYTVRTPSDVEGAPGRWPDPLIPTVDLIYGEPRNAFPVDVPAGESRVAWIDVLVPIDASPGLYRGVIDVRAEGLASRVPVELTVLELTLPSTPSLKSAFGLLDVECTGLGFEGCASPPRQAQVRQLFLRMALDNRITIAYAHARPILVGDASSVDEFRTYVLPFVLGTADTRLPGARLTTYQVNQVYDHRPFAWRAEIELQGFEDRAFMYSCDEPHYFPVYGDPAGNWPYCVEELRKGHAEWPSVRKLITTHIQSAEEHGSTDFDIVVVNIEHLHGPAGSRICVGDQRPFYDAFLADGSRPWPKEIWLYSACGSHGCVRNDHEYTRGWAGGYEIDAPASQTRAMAWIAFSYRMNGTLYYDTALQLAHAWDDQYRYTGNGEGTLFYPGTPDRIGGTQPVPVESMRMKYVRDGYEDYEYLKYLHDHGKAEDAFRIARQLFPAPFDTTRTDEQVQAARRELATRVAELTGGPLP